jgi:hypothetical protein
MRDMEQRRPRFARRSFAMNGALCVRLADGSLVAGMDESEQRPTRGAADLLAAPFHGCGCLRPCTQLTPARDERQVHGSGLVSRLLRLGEAGVSACAARASEARPTRASDVGLGDARIRAKPGVALTAFDRPPGPLEAGPLPALEREFGRVKRLVLSPLWFRGLDRFRLHAGLTGLAKLAPALAAEVTVRRHVQQTNSGRMPLGAFRVTVSGLAPLV